MATFREARLTAEKAFYTHVKASGTAARTEAGKEAEGDPAGDGSTYVVPASSTLGLTAGDSGAMTAFVAADFARAGFPSKDGSGGKKCRGDAYGGGTAADADTLVADADFNDCCSGTGVSAGYCLLLPNVIANPHNNKDASAATDGRDVSNVAGWRVDLNMPTTATINRWKGVGGHADTKLKAWWGTASTFHAAADAWNTGAWNGADGNADRTNWDLGTLIAADGSSTEADAVNGTSDKGCDGISGWTAVTLATLSSADAAGCKKHVEGLNKAGITANPDQSITGSDSNAAAKNNGGANSWAKYGAAPSYHRYYSFDTTVTDDEKCKYGDANDASSWSPAVTANAGVCKQLTMAKTFYDLAKAVYDANPGSGGGLAGGWGTKVTDLQTELDALAQLETNVLTAWYKMQYYKEIKAELADDAASSKQKMTVVKYNYIDQGEDADGNEVAGKATKVDGILPSATTIKGTINGYLTTANSELATLETAVTTATAAITALETRIRRHDSEITELMELVDTTADRAEADRVGTLDVQFNERKALYDAFIGGSGEFGVVDALKTSLTNSLVEAYDADGVTLLDGKTADDEGSLRTDARVAKTAWEGAKQTASGSLQALNDAIDGTTLTALREAVDDKTTAFNSANGDLIGKQNTLAGHLATWNTAVTTLNTAVAECQVEAYDEYRKQLAADLTQRKEDLEAIEKLLKAVVVPARGTEGARCEKALSLGTRRPRFAQGQETPCIGEDLCCGAARIWMTSGVTENAGWKVIETCQKNTATTFEYRPPRAPMQTTESDPIDPAPTFTCIEGAQKLAAAASALAAAIYMLA